MAVASRGTNLIIGGNGEDAACSDDVDVAYLEGAASNNTADDSRRGCLATLGAAIGPPGSQPIRDEVAAERSKVI